VNDPGATVILFSAAYELALQDLQTAEEKEAYMKEHGASRYVVPAVIVGRLTSRPYHSYFTYWGSKLYYSNIALVLVNVLPGM